MMGRKKERLACYTWKVFCVESYVYSGFYIQHIRTYIFALFFPIKMSCDILENIALLLMTGRILFNISN